MNTFSEKNCVFKNVLVLVLLRGRWVFCTHHLLSLHFRSPQKHYRHCAAAPGGYNTVLVVSKLRGFPLPHTVRDRTHPSCLCRLHWRTVGRFVVRTIAGPVSSNESSVTIRFEREPEYWRVNSTRRRREEDALFVLSSPEMVFSALRLQISLMKLSEIENQLPRKWAARALRSDAFCVLIDRCHSRGQLTWRGENVCDSMELDKEITVGIRDVSRKFDYASYQFTRSALSFIPMHSTTVTQSPVRRAHNL